MRLISIETREAPFIRAYRETAIAKGFDLILAPPSRTPSKAFKAFSEVYKHHSDNPINFELNCFRRYFDALDYAESRCEVIIADTDQLILSPPRNLPEIYFAPEAVVGSRGTTGGLAEADISPHFSKWPTRILRQFTEYLIQIYTDAPETLAQEYQKRRNGKGRAAVSDMTLFNMFIVAEKIPFYDSNSLQFTHYVDHNLSMSDTKDGCFQLEFGFKALRKDRSDNINLVAVSGEIIRPCTLHLQGRAKIAATSISKRKLRTARMRLGMLTAAKRLRETFQ